MQTVRTHLHIVFQWTCVREYILERNLNNEKKKNGVIYDGNDWKKDGL